MNPFYIIGFQQAKRNIINTQEKNKCLQCCNHAVYSATCGHFATNPEDSQHIYIILPGLPVGF
jgi:hypothetical protein